eukprot:m.150753 g.150753  ORF g.150753 m.150753 type:complete len:222 (-) comp24482_c0_seq1:445-1110(-)
MLGSLPCAEPRSPATRPHSWISNTTSTDEQMPDGMIADQAISWMDGFVKNKSSPFFLAVGFHKPHLPHFAPSKYFDMYPLENVSLPANTHVPIGLDDFVWNPCSEFLSYDDASAAAKEVHFNIRVNMTVEEQRLQRRAYFAATTYADAQIGRVLDKLDELNLTDNTIIALWGDHGWHLSENNEWAKHTAFGKCGCSLSLRIGLQCCLLSLGKQLPALSLTL